MNIYIVYATIAEVEQTLSFCKENFANTCADALGHIGFVIKNDTVFFIEHGVGVMHATYNISQIIFKATPHLIIQAGIAGSYNKDIALGDVLVVGADCLADVGAQNNLEFLSAQNLNLINAHSAPYINAWLINNSTPYPIYFLGLPMAKSITVNTATGNTATIAQWQNLYNPTLETMEGAALHYACLKNNIACVQVRAVSNYVTVRNKNNWQIPLAITNLNFTLINYLKTL